MSGERMDCERQDKKRMINVEEVDRLSSLPDDLIHKILSFIGLKHAIETSSLSSRWRFIWTSMPCLDFSIQDFPTLPKFSQFVTHVLSRRNNLTEVFSVKLHFNGDFSQDGVKQILNYAFSHNIQQLDVKFVLEDDIEFPLSHFRSGSLKHLSLTKDFDMSSYLYSVTATSTWELPALTTLYLHYIILFDENNNKCVGLFSKCVNLKKLTLKRCRPKGSDSLSISLPQLSDLILENTRRNWEVFNLVVPQLKNLTIRNSSWELYQVSAPQLTSLLFNGCHPLLLSTGDFHSLENVDLCVYGLDNSDAPRIVRLFKRFPNVKFLRLNLEILEFLSSYLELMSRNPSPFANLKSLKIYPIEELSDDDDEEPEKVNMSTKVKNYLLSNSVNATFTMVSREEIRCMKNTKWAQELLADLRLVLEQEKAKTETNMAHLKQGETHQLHIGELWNDFTVKMEQGKAKSGDIISRLERIKGLLIKLPTSKRAELQPCFSSLCVEADTVVNSILDHMKIQCETKGSNFSMCFHELAASTLQSSS